MDADVSLVGGMGGGGRGYGHNRDRSRLSWWGDNVAHVTLGMAPDYPLSYATVLELHQPIMSTIGQHRVQLDRDIPNEHNINFILNQMQDMYITALFKFMVGIF